jgi:quercetin dioxygenase-like cupin family protein
MTNITGARQNRAVLLILFFLAFPLGVYAIRKRQTATWKKIGYALLGFPLFGVLLLFGGILLFAGFLPALDTRPVNRTDRTIRNTMGDYEVTFLKTNLETNGAYELVRVSLAPGGGNDWHYHNRFVEKFRVLDGELNVGLDGKAVALRQGDTLTAPAHVMHKFYNTSSRTATFTVEINPGRSFERTLRIGYGLCNAGHCDENGMPDNPWHLVLLLAYSESYLPLLPGVVQEALFPALAKIAQWKGEHKALEPYYR